MLANRGKIGVLILVFFSSNFLLARDLIFLQNESERVEAFAPYISVVEDPTGQLTFKEVRIRTFESTQLIIANNKDEKIAYWLKFEIEAGEDLNRNKIFEILDFKIDSFELYLPDNSGEHLLYKGGDAYHFSLRKYKHKNFVFDLPHYKKGKYVGFIRIKATEVVGLNFAISNASYFLEYSNKEYLILSIFYGVIVSMALLSIFLYFYLYEKSYIFYSLYILSLGLYFLTRDGLGFQFLWPNHPGINMYCKPISVCMVVAFHLFFVNHYLNFKRYSITFKYLMYGLLILFPFVAYIADNMLGIIPDPLIAVAFIFIPLLFFSGKLALQGDMEARFFVVAYTVQFLGFLIFILAFVDLIGKNQLIFYSINIATAIEVIVFSLALAGKVKHLMQEKEQIKDQANRVLEQKVEERTRELKESNDQLDLFVYKASHDIKGPLKSMIGLTSLALSDVKDAKAKEYFEYMHATSTKLDGMVSELLRMGKVKDMGLNFTKVQLYPMVTDILSSLKHLPGFSRMKIEVNIPASFTLKTDEILIHSVLQNLIENAIKYMDPSKDNPYLKILLQEDRSNIHLSFEDNGLGIPADRKERIFEMFYKVNNNSFGSGLGLYLTKLTIEKLGGTLELISEEWKGTTFTINFKRA
jgi:signal transduction histidine kinase